MYELNDIYQSKYTYKLTETDNQIYVFEILLKKFNQKNKIIRKIKKTKQGTLISLDENIKFNEIKKINLTAIDINYPTNEINANVQLDQNREFSTFINNNIFLELTCKSGFLECNYRILD